MAEAALALVDSLLVVCDDVELLLADLRVSLDLAPPTQLQPSMAPSPAAMRRNPHHFHAALTARPVHDGRHMPGNAAPSLRDRARGIFGSSPRRARRPAATPPISRFVRKFSAWRERGRAIFSSALSMDAPKPRDDRAMASRPSSSGGGHTHYYYSDSDGYDDNLYHAHCEHQCAAHADNEGYECSCHSLDRQFSSYIDADLASTSSDSGSVRDSDVSILSELNEFSGSPSYDGTDWSEAEVVDVHPRNAVNTPPNTATANVSRDDYFCDTSPVTERYAESTEARSPHNSTPPATHFDNTSSTLRLFNRMPQYATDEDDVDEGWLVEAAIREAVANSHVRPMAEIVHDGYESMDNENIGAMEAVIRHAVAEDSVPSIAQLLEEDEYGSSGDEIIAMEAMMGLTVSDSEIPPVTEVLDSDNFTESSANDADSLVYYDSHPLHEYYVAGALSALEEPENVSDANALDEVRSDGELERTHFTGDVMEAILAYDSTDEANVLRASGSSRSTTSSRSSFEERGRAVAANASLSLRVIQALREMDSRESRMVSREDSTLDQELPSELELRISTDDDDDESAAVAAAVDWSLLDADDEYLCSLETLSMAEMESLSPAFIVPVAERSTICVICTDEIRVKSARRLPCAGAHVFHAECVDTWASHNATCPTCRSRIAPSTTAPPSDDDHDGDDAFGRPATPPRDSWVDEIIPAPTHTVFRFRGVSAPTSEDGAGEVQHLASALPRQRGANLDTGQRIFEDRFSMSPFENA